MLWHSWNAILWYRYDALSETLADRMVQWRGARVLAQAFHAWRCQHVEHTRETLRTHLILKAWNLWHNILLSRRLHAWQRAATYSRHTRLTRQQSAFAAWATHSRASHALRIATSHLARRRAGRLLKACFRALWARVLARSRRVAFLARAVLFRTRTVFQAWQHEVRSRASFLASTSAPYQ